MVGTQVLLDRYSLEREIASGGMGTVYEAVDERLGRRVAVKLLKRELANDPSFVERFRREARSAAALSHPNIANVYDYGEDEGQHFIVMELVEGRDLARALREDGPFSPERAVRVGAQICAALAHAHAAGVIHRDVKPANVIVGARDAAKVTDFGIARASGHATLTAAGSVMGSAQYISPEQAEGSNVGPPSDLYSAGVVVYEMLTGSVPFTGDSPVAVAMRHVSEDLPPPSELNPDVPRELDAVVARATAKSPRDRYADGAAMAGALEASVRPTAPLASGEPTAVLGGVAATQAIDDDRPLPLTHGWDANRLGKIVLTTFAVLLVAALVFLVARVLGADPEPAGTERDRRTAQGTGTAASPETPTPTESATEAPVVELPNEIIGVGVEDAEKVLEEAGFEIEIVPVESDAPENAVVDTAPPPGSEISPGDTITLFASAASDEDEGPSGEPQGQAKGQDKDKDKEKDEGDGEEDE